jgi:Mn2+/Fe2+ NRAMP family transporter
LFTWVDYIFLGIGIVGLLVMGFHHFFIKPKSIKQQEELDKLYQKGIDEIIKSIKRR